MRHERFPGAQDVVQESPAQVAAEFSRHLHALQDGRIRVMPSMVDDLNHEGRIPHDVSKYRRIAGLYMTQETMAAWGGDPTLPGRVDFGHMPYMGLGKDTSQRKVFFGGLHLPFDGRPVELEVAVKRFNPKNFHNAVHEAGMFEHIRGLGLPTLRVLGMLAVPAATAPQAFTITSFERGLDTLDNLNWDDMDMEEKWASVRPAIDMLALLHGNVLFHGDFEFKNVAFGEAERSLYVIDPEYAASLRDVVRPYSDTPDERQVVAQKVSADFASLDISARRHIISPGTDSREMFEDMLEHVYGPYYGAISSHIDSPYQDVLQGAFELVLEKKRQQAYGEQ